MNIAKCVRVMVVIAGAAISQTSVVKAEDEITQLEPFVVEATRLDFDFETAWEQTTQELRDWVNEQISDYIGGGYVITGINSATGAVVGPAPRPTGLTPAQEDQLVQERAQRLQDYINCLLAANAASVVRPPNQADGAGQTALAALESAETAVNYFAEKTNFAWEWASVVYRKPNGTYAYTLPATDRNLLTVTNNTAQSGGTITSSDTVIGLIHSHPQLHAVVTQQGGAPIVIADQFSKDDRDSADIWIAHEATKANVPIAESPFAYVSLITEKLGTNEKFVQRMDAKTKEVGSVQGWSTYPNNCI